MVDGIQMSGGDGQIGSYRCLFPQRDTSKLFFPERYFPRKNQDDSRCRGKELCACLCVFIHRGGSRPLKEDGFSTVDSGESIQVKSHTIRIISARAAAVQNLPVQSGLPVPSLFSYDPVSSVSDK